MLSTLKAKSTDIQDLANGGKALHQGATQLKGGANQINEGLKNAKAGSEQLHAGLTQQLSPGSEQLYQGVLQAQASVQETMELMGQLYQGLNALLANPQFSQNEMYVGMVQKLGASLAESEGKAQQFQALVAGAESIKNGLAPDGEFSLGLAGLSAGLTELSNGQETVTAGINNLADGTLRLSAGTESVNNGWNELIQNVTVLHGGTTQLKEGNATIAKGWQDLTKGAQQLYAGATQLRDGNQTVNEGWMQLTDGVTQVNNGIGELQTGANELASGLAEGAKSTATIKQPSEEAISMFASPVVLNGEVINEFQFYRDSTVPYIMSLALFAGIVAMSFIVPFGKTDLTPNSGISLFTGKVLQLGLLTILQALIISLYALLVLKVQVQSAFLFILFAIFVSLTFLMIVFFLVSLAGNLGRFIALAIIVLQLSTTGSDLPIHMLPESLRSLSVFLPLTYTIDGFTSAVTLGNLSNIWSNTAVLLIFFAIFGAATFAVFFVKFRNNESIIDDYPREEIS